MNYNVIVSWANDGCYLGSGPVGRGFFVAQMPSSCSTSCLSFWQRHSGVEDIGLGEPEIRSLTTLGLVEETVAASASPSRPMCSWVSCECLRAGVCVRARLFGRVCVRVYVCESACSCVYVLARACVRLRVCVRARMPCVCVHARRQGIALVWLGLEHLG